MVEVETGIRIRGQMTMTIEAPKTPDPRISDELLQRLAQQADKHARAKSQKAKEDKSENKGQREGGEKAHAQADDKAENKDQTGGEEKPRKDDADKDKNKSALASARAAALAQVEALNRKHFVINNLGGKCVVGEFIPSPIDAKCVIPSYQSGAAFTMRYANQKVGIINPEDFKQTHKELGTYWLKHRLRRSYEGLDLVANGPPELPGNRLNIWRGFGVEAKQGKYPVLRWHLDNILSNGDPLAAKYNWNWSAWAVQHPDEQAEVALCFQGLKGTGKGTWGHVIRRIFGPHGTHISQQGHLVGTFNAHLEGCVYLFADEAYAVDDKKAEGVLKGLITEPVLMCEPKHMNAYQIRNRLHVLIVANHKWLVPATGDERRFAVNQVSDARRNDTAYFSALYSEINTGGTGALFHDLLHTDLGNFHPRQVYDTKALQEQTGEEEWLQAVLQDGYIPGREDGRLDRVAANSIWKDAQSRIPKLRWMSETSFGNWLRKDWGCRKWRTANLRGWQFPPLPEMRAAWENKFGGWPWDEPELKEWQ
jgi:hypothetical protein